MVWREGGRRWAVNTAGGRGRGRCSESERVSDARRRRFTFRHIFAEFGMERISVRSKQLSFPIDPRRPGITAAKASWLEKRKALYSNWACEGLNAELVATHKHGKSRTS